MTEQQSNYVTQDEVTEAIDMLGKGYEEQPSVVVEPPRRRIERRGKQMMEVEEAAYVKFSTEFKAELADLDVYALKVFIYIGLSINFETGTAYPGVRKIAQETKMNKDTVAKAIEELEQKGFLQVRRKDGSSNIYKPECYFAIGETVPSGRTVGKPSDESAELSDENTKLSDASRVKSTQPDKQELNKIVSDLSIENQIFLGKTKIELSKADQIKNALREFFKLTPLWNSKFDRQWLQWAIDTNVTADQIKTAARKWGSDKRFNYSHPTLKGIAEHWLELIETLSNDSPYPKAEDLGEWRRAVNL